MRLLKSTLIPCALLVLSSCSSGPKGSGAATKTGAPQEFSLRPFQEETLANGLKIIFIEDHSLPRVSLNLLVKVGANQDPKDLEGLSHLTGWLLEDGTTTHSATRIADEFASLGTEIGASVTHETTSVSASSLAPQKGKLLNLFSEVILSPAYIQAEIERKRSQSLAALEKMVENPGGYADLLLNETLFVPHPYGRLVLGTASSLKRISKSDLIKHYFKYYRPNNSMLAVVGAIDEKFKQDVRNKFSPWQSREIETSTLAGASDAAPENIRLVSKPGLKQTQIRLGQLGIQRTDPDFLPLRIANVILGGAFESRLNQRVRDDLGLTYSIHSEFDARKDRGSFEISTFTRNDKVGETLRETQAVLKRFAEDGVSSRELDSAKALLIGQFPVAIETSDRLAFNLMVLRYYGVSDDYLKDFVSHVREISLKEVNQAIRKHFQPGKMKVVIFADQTQVLDQVKAMGAVKVEELK